VSGDTHPRYMVAPDRIRLTDATKGARKGSFSFPVGRFLFSTHNKKAAGRSEAGVLSENIAQQTFKRERHTAVVMYSGKTNRYGVRVREYRRRSDDLTCPAHAGQFFFLVGLIGPLVDDELGVVYFRESRGEALIGLLVDGLIRSEAVHMILTGQE